MTAGFKSFNYVLVWRDEASPRLGATAIDHIDSTFQSGEVTISATLLTADERLLNSQLAISRLDARL